MRPRLIIHPASHDEEVFELKQGATSVGRTGDNDVSVLHKSLSRAHARFDFTAGRVVLTDLGSKNGTVSILGPLLGPGEADRIRCAIEALRDDMERPESLTALPDPSRRAR